MYVEPASERISYFIIFVISILCLYQSFSLIQMISELNAQKKTYVFFVDNKTKDDHVVVNKIYSKGNKVFGLLEKMIEKYVINMESLVYSDDDGGMQAINDKSIIIKNLSSKNVYDNYMANSGHGDDSDVFLAVLKIKKTAIIDKIDFVYGDLNILQKLNSMFFTEKQPKSAKIYFTTETTQKQNKKHHFVATMYFDFSFNNNYSDKKSNIDFKVNDYYVEPDVSVEK